MLTVSTVYLLTDTLNIKADILDPVTDISQLDIDLLNLVKDDLHPFVDAFNPAVDNLHAVSNAFHTSLDTLYILAKVVGDPPKFRRRDLVLLFCQVIQPLERILNVVISD